MNKPQPQSLELPAQAPVMVLPTLVFPHAMLPLHIFEPRYRAMLSTALDDQRMFCVALLRRGVPEWTSPADFHHIACLGLVRVCVGAEDGTSNLILQGLARVRFTKFIQTEPFPIAVLEPLESIPADASVAARLVARLLSVCAQIREHGRNVPADLDEQLAQIEDPDLLSDIVADTFLRDPFRRQDVFEELRVGERLRLLTRHLTTELVRGSDT